jgi:hypothetical protein
MTMSSIHCKCGAELVDLVEFEPEQPPDASGLPAPEPGRKRACPVCMKVELVDVVRGLHRKTT